MTLTDLQNEHYAVAVREAMMDLILGRHCQGWRCGRDALEYLLWSEGFYA